MTDDDIFERVKNTLINCQHFPAHLITPDASIETLGGDSLDDVELTILLEEEFNIEIKDGSIDMNTPISKMVTIIKGLI
jgi:acyl carrier protein